MAKKILIVEDHEIVRHLLRLTLSHNDYQLLECSSAIDALEHLKKDIPDLIILDVMMQGDIDGYKLCETLKNHDLFKSIKIILLTARAQINDVKEGERVMADAYIVKPFSPLKLINKVDYLLKSH